MRTLNSPKLRSALLLIFVLMTGSFVWFYGAPLATDMPLHTAMAKAFLVILSGDQPENYSYEMDLRISSYAPAELLLVPLIWAFGVTIGAKIALTLYCIAFPLCIAFLVGQISPNAFWSRFVGFPLTLTYFFHWGFWPSLLGGLAVLFAIAMTLKYEGRKNEFWVLAITRLLAAMMHPIAVVSLLAFDAIYLGAYSSKTGNWLNILKWNWPRLLATWVPTTLFMAIGVVTSGQNPDVALIIKWGSIRSQLIQLIRPFYTTSNWWEGIVPVGLGGLITLLALRDIVSSKRTRAIFAAAVMMVIAGLVFPRDRGFGSSWELGARTIFSGEAVVFALWAVAEKRLKSLIGVWVVAGLAATLIISHQLWSVYSPSYEAAIKELRDTVPNSCLRVEVVQTPSSPTINLGGNLAVWAWADGYAADAFNLASGRFGPVKQGEQRQKILADPSIRKIKILYHPIERLSSVDTLGSLRLLADDPIFTIIEDMGATMVSRDSLIVSDTSQTQTH